MLHVAAHAFVRFRTGHVNVTFEIRAAVLLKRLFLVCGQLDVNRDFRLAVRRNGVTRGNAFARFPVKKQLRVDGGDHFVAVHIGNRQNIFLFQFGILAAQIIEDRLRIEFIGDTVSVDVMALFDHARTVPIIGDAARRKHCGVMQKVSVFDRLREQLGVQFIGQRLIGQVVDREAEVILARLLRIVAQLDLNLAVRCRAGLSGQVGVVRIHHDDAGCGDRQTDVRKARALLQDRQIVAVRLHRRRGAHQQALDDRTRAEVGSEFRIGNGVLAQVFRNKRRKTRDVRRRHGRAAHVAVLVGRGHFIAVDTVDGVDIAARRGDLGLHDQRARNAPGAEVGNERVLTRIAQTVLEVRSIVDRDPAAERVVCYAVCSVRCSLFFEQFRVISRDVHDREAAGERAVIDAADQPGGIVRDRDSLRAVTDRVVDLLVKRQIAAVDNDDLARKGDRGVDRLILCRRADRIDINEVIAACDRGHARIVEGRAARLQRFRVEDALIAVLHRGAGRADVVRRRNAEAVDERARRTAGMEVRVLFIKTGQIAVIEVKQIVERVRVARRDRNDHALVHGLVCQFIQFILIARRIGVALRAGTERKVRHVAVEHDRVFQCAEIVGIVCAAARAEHLHDEQLRVGRHADRMDRRDRIVVRRTDEAVGRRDTGNVRAVIALAVGMTDRRAGINVVVCVRDLRADVVAGLGVQLTCEILQLRPREQLVRCARKTDRVRERLLGKRLMGSVDTGVDDRDAAARAGVARAPRRGCADHIGTGVRGVRLIALDAARHFVPHFQFDGLDARNAADRRDVLIRDLDGDRVDQKRQVPFDGQLVTDHAFDLRLHRVLLSSQALAVFDRTAVFCNAAGRESLIDSGLAVQEDRNADDLFGIAGRIIQRFQAFAGNTMIRFRFIFLAQFMDVQCRGIQILHLERCALRRRIGFRTFRDRARDARRNRHREQHEHRDQHGEKSSHFGHAS